MIKHFFSKLIYHLKRLFAYAGPGYLVAVGYMDPGNWATDIAGGATYGYILLSVILISNFMAMLLQFCALKLGLISGKDLAQACRDYYSPFFSRLLWIFAECAVIATDLAEVIGSAIGLQLLFDIPLAWGVCITAADVLFLLMFTNNHMKMVEILVTTLIGIIGICFGIIIFLAHPAWLEICKGCIPSVAIVQDPHMLYLAIGILGATVMPHNLYLHSSLVKKNQSTCDISKQTALFYLTLDSHIALIFAFFINASILIVSAATFHTRGLYHIAEIQDAYYLLTPILSAKVASYVFAIALLLSGQNSTFTGTLTGQIIMEGFINIRIARWIRRLIGRCITIIPALIGIIVYGQQCLSHMMIFSQIVLSLQLPFAIFPLIHFTSDSSIMGKYKNSYIVTCAAYAVGIIIVCMNILLLMYMK